MDEHPPFLSTPVSLSLFKWLPSLVRARVSSYTQACRVGIDLAAHADSARAPSPSPSPVLSRSAQSLCRGTCIPAVTYTIHPGHQPSSVRTAGPLKCLKRCTSCFVGTPLQPPASAFWGFGGGVGGIPLLSWDPCSDLPHYNSIIQNLIYVVWVMMVGASGGTGLLYPHGHIRCMELFSVYPH